MPLAAGAGRQPIAAPANQTPPGHHVELPALRCACMRMRSSSRPDSCEREREGKERLVVVAQRSAVRSCPDS